MKKSEGFSEKSVNITDSDNLSNHQRSKLKKSLGNTIVCRFLQGILFHTLREDGANTTNIWSPPKKLLQL